MSFRDESRSYKKQIAFSQITPHNDDLPRDVCDHCGLINYQNPRLIVGVVALWEDKILMCKRAIEPRKHFWTLPAGFMEKGETTKAGAAREAYEETYAKVEPEALIGIYNVARIAQVHIYYRARLLSKEIACGVESEAVALLDWEDIPWDALAFPSIYWALQHYKQTATQSHFAPFSEPEEWAQTPGFEDLHKRYRHP